jgi:hypothetical protein
MLNAIDASQSVCIPTHRHAVRQLSASALCLSGKLYRFKYVDAPPARVRVRANLRVEELGAHTEAYVRAPTALPVTAAILHTLPGALCAPRLCRPRRLRLRCRLPCSPQLKRVTLIPGVEQRRPLDTPL